MRRRTQARQQAVIDPMSKPGIAHLFGVNTQTLETIRFCEPVPDYFTCVVCREVPLEPVEHSENGCHIVLCKPCHNSYVHHSNKTCPNCRTGNVLQDFRPMHRVLRVNYFETLTLRCKNSPHCDAVVSIANREQHETSCEFSPQPCPVRGCTHLVVRTMLAQHIYDMGIDHIEQMVNTFIPAREPNKASKSEEEAKSEITDGEPDELMFSLFGNADY